MIRTSGRRAKLLSQTPARIGGRPTTPRATSSVPPGPTCDGCHATQPSRSNIFNASAADAVASTDTCIQCHSQGQPRGGLIDGKAYDWPVGYRVGLRLQDYWKLEPHVLGETSFTHYADGTAHKNRMQGNDFVQSVMYRRGVTCASCHDARLTTTTRRSWNSSRTSTA
jgi:hypothetical protein